MQQQDPQSSEPEKYPGGYVPAPVTPTTPPAGTPASVGERHPVNLSECADRYILEMSIPGACAADFFVRVDGKGLLIGREGAADEDPSRTRLCRHEFDTKPFRRYIPMPEGVDPERIMASYANGILKLDLPKGGTEKDCPVIQVPVY
jgi:HSP20 family protein